MHASKQAFQFVNRGLQPAFAFNKTIAKHTASVYTLFDLSFLEHPEYTTKENYENCFSNVFEAACYADTFVAISEYTKDVTYVDNSIEPLQPDYKLIDKGSDLKSTLRNKAIDASNYDIKLYDKDGKETTATKAGAGYYAEIIGKNNYTGTIGKEKTEYNIGVDIAGTVIELYNPLTKAQYKPNADGTYDINWIGYNKPVHKLKFNSTEYTDSDNVYTVKRVNDGTDAGSEVTVEFTATGTGGFYSSGSHSYTYRINPIDISKAEPAVNPATTEGLTYNIIFSLSLLPIFTSAVPFELTSVLSSSFLTFK